jgi:hypothetical protein
MLKNPIAHSTPHIRACIPRDDATVKPVHDFDANDSEVAGLLFVAMCEWDDMCARLINLAKPAFTCAVDDQR